MVYTLKKYLKREKKSLISEKPKLFGIFDTFLLQRIYCSVSSNVHYDSVYVPSVICGLIMNRLFRLFRKLTALNGHKTWIMDGKY